jgi:uncharacterized protein YdeI (YjbR/CyaY-like superfamily)
MPKTTTNPKVDSYIANAQPFAQPILNHLRKLIHKACPEVEENIKWSMPFFEYRGTILCNFSAFKAHCSFGFWGKEMKDALQRAGAVKDGAMGSLGKITSVNDLPPDKEMLGWVLQAAESIANGTHVSPIAARNKVVKARKPEAEVPKEFAAALKDNKKASKVFEAFSPSCKREYVEWIADAKREETRQKRIETAVEWIAEGKQRNWKYQNC